MQFKNTLVTLIVAAALPLAAGAHFAKDGLYVHGFGGVAFPHNPGAGISTKTGLDLGAAVGMKYHNFRYEGEFNWQRASARFAAVGGNINVFALMANVHYDFDELMHIHPQIVPSLGVGIGYAHMNANAAGLTRNDDAFAYQAMANVNYHMTNDWSVNVGYKYFGTTNFSYVPGVNRTWQNHMINLGVTYRLG